MAARQDTPAAGARERAAAVAREAFDGYAPQSTAALACRAGCSFCCRSLLVEASPPEIFALAARIDALPAARRADVQARIRAADDATRGLSVAQRVAARVPCPLLEDDRCSVYDSRPLSCRAAVSLDAGACESSFNGVPAKVPMPRAFMDALGDSVRGLGAALARIGLPLRGYELNAALRVAVETKDAATRWQAGEDVFAPAEVRR
jgi:Fe-S-cluster containining protein